MWLSFDWSADTGSGSLIVSNVAAASLPIRRGASVVEEGLSTNQLAGRVSKRLVSNSRFEILQNSLLKADALALARLYIQKSLCDVCRFALSASL
jgi:hypothetical protein